MDNHHKVLESWYGVEKVLLDHELDLQESVLKAAHESELDTMDSTIQTLKHGLEILGLTTVDKKDEKATSPLDTTGVFIQTEALHPPHHSHEGLCQFTARRVHHINTHQASGQ